MATVCFTEICYLKESLLEYHSLLPCCSSPSLYKQQEAVYSHINDINPDININDFSHPLKEA